jgi:hypothetical protein
MPQQSDMFEETQDVLLTERLTSLPVWNKIMGMYRTPDQYANSQHVAEILMHEVGVRNVIEFCTTELERRSANEQS